MRTRMLTLLVTGAVMIPAGAALAATAGPGYGTLHVREDGFVNYDYGSRSVSRSNVDWAVTLLFYNNASINRVKNSAIGPLYDQTGSTQHGLLSDNRSQGFAFDDDGGRKTTKCPGAPFQPDSAKHYRIYADGDDRLYNLSYGYYVYGSTHWDIYECGSGQKRFGYSESAEEYLVSQWNSRVGGGATNDWGSFSNREPYRVEGDHVWDNNQFASLFRVG